MNIIGGNSFVNEVDIDLNMLSALMLDWNGRQVNYIDIVTLDESTMQWRWWSFLSQRVLATPFSIP